MLFINDIILVNLPICSEENWNSVWKEIIGVLVQIASNLLDWLLDAGEVSQPLPNDYLIPIIFQELNSWTARKLNKI